ncbi:ribonuclease P protein component [Sphingobacterium sp. Mn56C]|uniref:ribonuclease P protein component n=1 Tax=Sphingobacterium sp. Mn56C TaxID=3395261 RepID=UPI003BCE6CAC
MSEKFKKEERLCSKSAIDELFKSGSSFVVFPFRVVFLANPVTDKGQIAQVIISVSKRRFKRANARNRIKRLMREAYRLQKEKLLYAALREAGIRLNLAIQYVGKEELSFVLMHTKMEKALKNLLDELIKNNTTGI